MPRFRTIFVAALGMILAMMAGTSHAAKLPVDLLISIERANHPAITGDPQVLRSRVVKFADSPANAPGQISGARLNFFNDAGFVLKVKSWQSESPSDYTAVGCVEGDPDSDFVLSSVNGVIVANLWSRDGHAYQIRPLPGGDEYLSQELRPSTIADCACDASHRMSLAPAPVAATSAPMPQCPSSIDVLIVYTAQARTSAGGETALRALANACIASTNLAYDNSGIATRARAVRIAEVSYDESNVLNTDLLRLRIPGDGYLDEVHALRNSAGADAVCLLVASSGTCGIAYVMSTPAASFESLAFSVVSTSCAVGNLSFAHELGHNLGCEHNQGQGSNGAFPFAYGHRFTGLSGTQWRTVMSAVPGLRIAHFSNPSITYDAVPTGVPEGQPNPADNARCIAGTAGIVSGFRAAPIVDCNHNLQNDTCDLANHTSADVNENGVPDECDSPLCEVPASILLHAQTPRSLDDFGVAVALSRDGRRLVVGSDLADDRGLNSGAADVFERVGDRWSHQSRLTSADGFAFQQFGRSVAISPDGAWIAIGAPRDGFALSDVGAAYIFHLEAGGWVQTAKLIPPDPMQADFFGFSVAISADPLRVAIGSPFNDQGGPQSGAVYVFRQNVGGWMPEAKVIADDAAPNSEFGYSVSMTDGGDRVLVGARSDDHVQLNAGTSYVFIRNGKSWSQEARLSPPGVAAGDRLGTSVALDGVAGQIAVVGAPRHDTAGLDAGAVWIFSRNGSTWTPRQKLTATDGAMGRLFGASVAATSAGDLVLVGSPLDVTTFSPTNQGVISGSAFLFSSNGSNWSQQVKLRSVDAAANDNLGSSVALGGGRTSAVAALGSLLDDLGGEVDAGSVRVFASITPQPDCNGNGLPDACDIAHGISLDGDHNGTPDECEPGACPADIAGTNGLVDIDDLGLVITSWGECPIPCQVRTCLADVNHDCTVDIDDLVNVIVNWGPCPVGSK